MSQTSAGNDPKPSPHLYLPPRITKPENWQCIKLIAPNGSQKQWKTSECVGAFCEKCRVKIKYDPLKGNTKRIQRHMEKYHASLILDFNKK